MLYGGNILGSQSYGDLLPVIANIIILRRRIEGSDNMPNELREYGIETTINFELFEVDGVNFRVDAVHAAGDSVIMKNEGAEASTANGFTDKGKGYSLVLSATEMQAARIVIYLADLTAIKIWLDKAIVIETYGHASAMHAFDLNTALQDVNIQSSDNIDLTATQKVSVNTEVDTALTDYGANTVEPDPVGTAPTAIENRAEMDSNSTGLAAIFANTNTDIPASLAAIFNDTNIDIPALIAGLNDASSSDILTTALTEAYAADGAPATLSQLLYMIWSMMNSLGFVLTVGTARKLDGSTPAMTFEIDDPDQPTDINRVT
jgi:hypothetical protein